MANRLCDFAIIGAMKCGTSTLHEQLALRSGIWMSDPKEPNFFSDDAQYARGLDWYARLFEGAGDDQLCGESSTHYTKLPTYPRTLERLSLAVESPRLIYIMRHPIDRIVSQYIHEWTQREVSGSFDAAVASEERFIAYSCYARQLGPYVEKFGRESILPVFFEHMVAHPQAELERVCDFLSDPSPEPVRWNEDRGAQNTSSQRLRQSKLRDAISSLPPVQFAKDLLPEAVRERLRAPWKLKARPTLSPVRQAEVESRIDGDLKTLGEWLGMELSCATWKANVVDHRPTWGAATNDVRQGAGTA